MNPLTDRNTIIAELFKNPVEKEIDGIIVEKLRDQSDDALLARVERRVETLIKDAAKAASPVVLSYEDATEKAWLIEETNQKRIAKIRDLKQR